jgi:hypothetical protein
MKRPSLLLVLWAAVIVSQAPASAESDLLARTLSAADQDRLAAFDAVREASIKVAREEASAPEAAVLEDILGGEPQPVLGVDIRGDYRCRIAKLDGIVPLIVYDWFRCAIGEDDIGYRLEKTTGSQRLSGHFVDDSETSLVFYGAGHYGNEQPKSYGDNERNIVVRFVKLSEDRYRLEMPLPQVESKFDILELKRR